MAGVLLYLTVVGVLGVVFVVAAVVALAHAVGRGAASRLIASALLLIIGTVPPSVLAVLWYARTADYRWAIRGPGPFAHLGAGPATLAAFTLVTLWTAGCWTAAVWLGASGARQRSRGDV